MRFEGQEAYPGRVALIFFGGTADGDAPLGGPARLRRDGWLLSERSGITNIALEGFMLMGAFAAVAGTWFFNSPMIGLVVAIVVGAVGGLVFAFWTVTLRADQIVAGTAIVLLGLGLTSFLTEQIWGQAGSSPPVERLPTIGLGMNVFPVAFLLVPLTDWFLFKTKAGLRVLACGEKPEAAQAVGIDVARYRYAMVVISGVLAAVGGRLPLDRGSLPVHDNITAGRGFIALAAVIRQLDAVGDDGSGAPIRIRPGVALPCAGARLADPTGSHHRPALSPDAGCDHRTPAPIDATGRSGTTPDRGVMGHGAASTGYRLSG